MEAQVVGLKCECGKVSGELIIDCSVSNHIVCCCDDCQSFAYYLGREKLLDKYQGSEIYQTVPRNVKILKGQENIGCIRLGPKGLMRWYAKCCNLPIANTLGAKVSFNGISCAFIDTKNRDEVLGKIQSYNMMKFSPVDAKEWPSNGALKFSKLATLKMLKSIALGSLFKYYRPNSFFDLETGKPKVEPFIISKDEREKLRDRIKK